MGISRISIRNYRGIEARDIDVPPGGAIVKGRVASGKTSVLKAIRAALEAQDISSDAIRLGTDKAEVLVDLDDHSVRRVITSKGATLTVTKAGMQARKPQGYLAELLGTSSLDPMDLLTLKPKERRARILEALPVTVTLAQLRQWVPRLGDEFDSSGHGLEIVERLRERAYTQRTAANAAAKAARQEAERAAAAVEEASEKVPLNYLPDLAMQERRAEAAKAAVSGLRARAEEAARLHERTESTRNKVVELTAKAVGLRALANAKAPGKDFLDGAALRADETRKRVRDLENALAVARRELEVSESVLGKLEAAAEQAEKIRDEAATLDAQVAVMQEALAVARVEPVRPEDLEAAETNATVAEGLLVEARTVALARKDYFAKEEIAGGLAARADLAEAEAARLDAVVHKLTHDAPAALLDACDGIPGLSLSGENIMLDGVSLDGLSGGEAVKFCVEIARRANAKSKILIVDGLERLDKDSLDVFVREATRDGYQLLGTKVDQGEIVIEAIEPAACDKAAE